MNYAEDISQQYPRSENIWDIFSSIAGGKTSGKLSAKDICNAYKYTGALSKSRRMITNDFPNGILESDLVAHWLIQSFSIYKNALEGWQFTKQKYGAPHKKTVPIILPNELTERQLLQVRYEKYIEMWLYNKYCDTPLPATIYTADLKKTNQQFLGKCISYERYLKIGSGEAVDLISLQPNSNRHKLYILELKSGCSKETLLRCLLEAYTYAKMIKPEWRNEFYRELGIQDQGVQLVICPLFFNSTHSRQYDEFIKESKSGMSQIKALSQKIEASEKDSISVEFAYLDYNLMPREIKSWLDFEASRVIR